MKEAIFDELPDRPLCHAATVVEAGNRDLLVAWYAGHSERATDVAIFASRLETDAGSWSEPTIISDTPGRADDNPVLFVTADVTVWLYHVFLDGSRWSEARIVRRHSLDDGRSWSAIEQLDAPQGWVTRSKPLITESGALILPLYDSVREAPLVAIGAAEGDPFEFVEIPTRGLRAIQPTLVQRDDGRLLALMRSSYGSLFRSFSDDEGRHWSTAAPTDLPNPDAAADMVRLASGSLALAFNDSSCSRTPLVVALSDDEGETWPYRMALETGDGEFSYPAIIQDSSGLLHVVYTWRRAHIEHAWFTESDLRRYAAPLARVDSARFAP